ncbi:MAG: hypothetical protein P8Z79_15835 [Sedimentisphaerales bacterium]|jgi:hypothetical protein
MVSGIPSVVIEANAECFGPVYCNLAAARESSGYLVNVLDCLATLTGLFTDCSLTVGDIQAGKIFAGAL